MAIRGRSNASDSGLFIVSNELREAGRLRTIFLAVGLKILFLNSRRKICGKADKGKALGDMRVPNAMTAPDPAAGILGGRRCFVGVEAGEVHAPYVTIFWGQ